MALGQQGGRYDHPAMISRDIIPFGRTTAGANTIQFSSTAAGPLVFPFDIIVRNIVATVGVAGTSTSPGSAIVVYAPGTSVQRPPVAIVTAFGTATGPAGVTAVTAVTTNTTTTTLGVIPIGTNTANSLVQSGDLNVRIPAGQGLVLKNGTDATAVASCVMIEYHLDPQNSLWTGGT